MESPSNFQVKEKKLFQSVHKQEIGLLWSSESFEGKYKIGIEIPKQRKDVTVSYGRNLIVENLVFENKSKKLSKVATLTELKEIFRFKLLFLRIFTEAFLPFLAPTSSIF